MWLSLLYILSLTMPLGLALALGASCLSPGGWVCFLLQVTVFIMIHKQATLPVLLHTKRYHGQRVIDPARSPALCTCKEHGEGKNRQQASGAAGNHLLSRPGSKARTEMCKEMHIVGREQIVCVGGEGVSDVC